MSPNDVSSRTLIVVVESSVSRAATRVRRVGDVGEKVVCFFLRQVRLQSRTRVSHGDKMTRMWRTSHKKRARTLL